MSHVALHRADVPISTSESDDVVKVGAIAAGLPSMKATIRFQAEITSFISS